MPSIPSASVQSMLAATTLLLAPLATESRAAILLVREGSVPVPVATFQAAVDELALHPSSGEPYTGELILTDAYYSGPGNRELDLFPLAGSTFNSITLRNATGERLDCVIDLDGFRIAVGAGTPGIEFRHLVLEDGRGVEGSGPFSGWIVLVDCEVRDLDLRGTICSVQSSTVQRCSMDGLLIADGSAFADFDAQFTGFIDVSDCTFREGTGSGNGLFSSSSGTEVGRIEIRNSSVEGCSAPAIVHSVGASIVLDGVTMVDNQGFLVVAGGGDFASLDVTSCTFAGNHNPGHPLIQTEETSSLPIGIAQTILAFNDVSVPYQDDSGAFGFTCNDVYGNSGGDYVGALAARLGVEGNISADPLFCALGLGDVYLQHGSPADAGCGLMGSRPVGCDASEVGEVASVDAAVRVWPSPTRGAVQVEWNVESASIVREPWRARVVDALGRTVRELGVRHEDGRALVGWDGRDEAGREVPTGVYWVHVEGSAHLSAARVLSLR